MDLNDAKNAAEEIMKIRKPRSYDKRDEVVADLTGLLEDVEAFREELSEKIEALSELANELDEKVQSLQEAIDLLSDGERTEFEEHTENIKAAAEEVHTMLI